MTELIALQIERNKLIDDWARYTAERLQKSIEKRKVGKTGSLKYSIIYQLMSATGGDTSSIKHMFNYYGRFVDMGVGKGVGLSEVKGNADLVKLMGGRKPKKWYSKTYYAEKTELAELLADKYKEQGTLIVKETFE